MQYLLLIYTTEDNMPAEGTVEFKKMTQDYAVLTRQFKDKHIMIGGSALQAPNKAITVQVIDGRTEMSDGPFARVEKQLRGFYLLDCGSVDEAIDYAAKLPSARWGSIEVRPLVIFGA